MGSDAPVYGLYGDEGTLPVDLIALKAFMGHKIPQDMPKFWDELASIKVKVDDFLAT